MSGGFTFVSPRYIATLRTPSYLPLRVRTLLLVTVRYLQRAPDYELGLVVDDSRGDDIAYVARVGLFRFGLLLPLQECNVMPTGPS